MKKKIIYITILLVFIVSIIIVVAFVNSSKENTSSSSNTTVNKSASTDKSGENKAEENRLKDKLVLKDNYFITQINDIYYNTKDYIGREIEIEGFPMSSENYRFVARYGPGCCVGDGFAYMEYEYDKQVDLVDEQDWIKVTGTIEEGNDGITDYVYIKASSVEKMDTRGVDTVAN